MDNINFNKRKGTYSFVSHKEPAWHGLGQIVEQAMTSSEAIELANLDYEIKKAKLLANIQNDNNFTEINIPVNNYYATYRADTNSIFGIVTERYEIVQNKEAFKFMDSIVGEGKAIYETAGALGMGEVVFITAKLPYYIRINGYDTIENYLVVSISHDGTSSVNIFLTPIRVVCQNTLALGLSKAKFKYKFKHTRNVHDKMDDASNILKISKVITEETEEMYKHLVSLKATDEKVEEYIHNLFLTKDEMFALANEKVKLKYSDEISTRKKNVIKDILKYYEIGIGQDGIRGTAFGAYNAITGYFSNIKKYKDDSNKMKSLVLGGNDSVLNAKAVDLALEMFA